MIADAGPLIVLYKTGQLRILKELYRELIIPEAVRQELITKPEGIRLLEDNPWITTKKVRGTDALGVLRVFLDQGESEAIILARETGHALLMDERKGRRIAVEMGIQIRGTLGALVEAKNKGIVKNVGEEIQKMLEKGYRIDKELMKIILRKAREERGS